MYIFHDYLPMWAAGRALREGLNPYDPIIIAKILFESLKAEGHTLSAWPGGFMYPPWSLWFFIIFSLPPLSIAKYLWSIIACGAIFLVIRSEAKLKESPKNIPFATLIIALVAFLPLTKQPFFGQSSWIVLFAMYFCWHCFQSRKYRTAGVFFGLAQIKSHILLGFSALMIIHALRERNIIFLLYFCLIFTIENAVALCFDAQIFNNFVTMISSVASTAPPAPRATTIDFISTVLKLEMPRYVGLILTLFGVLLAGLIGLLPKIDNKHRDGVILISLLTSPFCWVNDYLLLLPLYIGLVSTLYKHSRLSFLIFAALLTLSGIWISSGWVDREVWAWLYLPLLLSLYLFFYGFKGFLEQVGDNKPQQM